MKTTLKFIEIYVLFARFSSNAVKMQVPSLLGAPKASLTYRKQV